MFIYAVNHNVSESTNNVKSLSDADNVSSRMVSEFVSVAADFGYNQIALDSQNGVFFKALNETGKEAVVRFSVNATGSLIVSAAISNDNGDGIAEMLDALATNVEDVNEFLHFVTVTKQDLPADLVEHEMDRANGRF